MTVSRSRITGSYAERRERLGPLPYMVAVQPKPVPRWLRIGLEFLAVSGFVALAIIVFVVARP